MINLSNVSGLITNKPANDIEIQEIEDVMKVELPNVHKNLLKYTNGFSIGGWLIIYHFSQEDSFLKEREGS
ncbi:SMI1/KNR4 family protein [Bacillus thuringiensis]|uniref:SMI1/KNR4 family protein n=1 Tax=Bacillus cereus group TaxID=86661 RepID=UPI003CF70E41